MELGTHVEVALALGGWQDNEQDLARQLWDRLPSDALLIEDPQRIAANHDFGRPYSLCMTDVGDNSFDRRNVECHRCGECQHMDFPFPH